jgi:uncharacterized membrane protein (UPF0127 family)
LRRNAGVAIAATVAVAALAGMVVLIARARDTDDHARLSIAATEQAAAPFRRFREARVGLGDRCLRVLVATDGAQRSQGLRDVEHLRPYDGMLFVFPADSDARFTMSRTPLPLDITWFAADGSPVDRTTMEPCPEGDDASCPTYGTGKRYRYALERPAGAPGAGALGSCA